MFLYTNGDGVKQDDIVSGVAVSKPAISRTVVSIEKKGYVNKRAYLVYMTDKARQGETFIRQQYADLVTATATGIPEEKVVEFIEIFKQVADNLDNHRKATLK